MRRTIVAIAAVALGSAVADPAAAAHGTVSLSWGTCSPVVANVESPAAGPLSLVVSVSGNDQAHNAYHFKVLVHGADDITPDAWRFDAAGCQGSNFLQMNPLPVGLLGKSCPAFQGTGHSIQIRDYRFAGSSSVPDLPETWMVATFANTYPEGNTTVAAQRYHLATFVFEHQYSVTGAATPGVECGGFALPMILSLRTPYRGHLIGGDLLTSYLRAADGIEVSFDPGGNETVTVNGSLPAAATSWGQIKGAYRR